jgi:glycopeptide antibiotics resistance protein
MIRNKTRNQRISWMLFLLYLALLVYFLFFSESLGRDPSQREYAYNLELFKEIRRFYIYREQLGMKAFIINDIGNVVAFLPFGFFLPVVLYHCERYWWMTILLSFLFTLGIELTQLVLRVGSFDVDDIFLNTVGGILGYLAYQIVQQTRIWRRKHGKV